jgi:hypothetical protein
MDDETPKTNDERHFLIDRNTLRLYSKMVFLAEYFDNACKNGGITLTSDAAAGLSCCFGDLVSDFLQMREWNLEIANSNNPNITATITGLY